MPSICLPGRFGESDDTREWAEENDAQVHLLSLPGAFVSPRRPLLSVSSSHRLESGAFEGGQLANAFVIAHARTFSDDPRFGLVVLAEIASRALSPAVNDPDTAIDIINRLGRILLTWDAAGPAGGASVPQFDRVHVPPLLAEDLFEDAFAPIARDGAGTVEVGVRLQKTLGLLAQARDPGIREAAIRHGSLARARAEETLTFRDDLERLRRAAYQSMTRAETDCGRP